MALDVLIVDDSAGIRKILFRILSQTGIPIGRTFEASDGIEAIAILRAQSSVGLILADINMPNMDGLQLLAFIRAEAAWAKLPFIMITTDGSPEKITRATDLGVSAYLRKPFTADQVKDAIIPLMAAQVA